MSLPIMLCICLFLNRICYIGHTTVSFEFLEAFIVFPYIFLWDQHQCISLFPLVNLSSIIFCREIVERVRELTLFGGFSDCGFLRRTLGMEFQQMESRYSFSSIQLACVYFCINWPFIICKFSHQKIIWQVLTIWNHIRTLSSGLWLIGEPFLISLVVQVDVLYQTLSVIFSFDERLSGTYW